VSTATTAGHLDIEAWAVDERGKPLSEAVSFDNAATVSIHSAN
jgi:hypothetical protein